MEDFYLDRILPLGVLTGSRAFGCATESSDWDIAIIESRVPEYQLADDYQVHEMRNLEYITECPEAESDLNEDSEYEYDKISIWGPIERIIKYWYLTDPEDESTEVCINLFVYKDEYINLYPKFIELNNLMKFVHNTKLKDRDYRIDAFIEIIDKVGITNA